MGKDRLEYLQEKSILPPASVSRTVERSSTFSSSASAELSGQGIIATAVRNSAFVLGAQVAIKIMAFLFNVYIVRRLGAVHFGQYSAVIAYLTIFGIFTDLGMATYSVREMAEDHRRTSWLLPNIVVIRMLLSLVIICIAPLSAYWLGKGHDMVLGVLIASTGQLLYALQGPLDSALTARERLDYTAAFSLVNQLVFWGLGVLFLASGMGFVGLILASLVGVGSTASLSGWVLFRKLGVERSMPSVRHWPRLLSASLPFGISGVAYVFMQRFDTVLMSVVLTDAEVGWYNAPCSLITMMLLLAQSTAIALYPSMVRGYKTDPGSLRDVMQRSIRYFLLICLPIVVGGTILADRIILFLYTEEFAPSVPVLRIAMWALPSLFLLELVGRSANALHLERPAAKINIVNAAFTVLLNLILVPTMGVIGGALALVLGRAIRLLQFWSLIGNERLVGRQWLPLLRVVLSAGLMGGAVFFLRRLPLIPCVGIGAALYTALVLGLRAVDVDELRYLGKALVYRGDLSLREVA